MIAIATTEDIPQIVQLLNSAYRGESSKRGWTTEADLIAGDRRTDAASVAIVMNQPGSIILKYTNEEGEIIGTVNLQQHERGVYLGMFAVSPNQQGGGIGKQLLNAADEHAKNIGSGKIYMSVISVRKELIDWYKRHGYAETGERKPFVEDDLTGKHLQKLEFLILEKNI
ncbi:GNAT family N-acetyltransferase [Lacibacter sediminis]|uniref:GNAT family N-acetyltransferase n=1 Tax=Lacibacter sediminis TaxID=2760713 RepID=A0A7G5XMF0_9BACT|nr:GNAT family N-acetyltransferase [Lacibacter sediminis]QNA46653.1 GNAT family N-acetyltransferase [Lacibacter sediminis]